MARAMAATPCASAQSADRAAAVAAAASFALLGCLIWLGGTGCASLTRRAFDPPRVRLESVRLHKLSLLAADLRLDFQVENPNRVGLVIDGMSYRLRVNGQPLASGNDEARHEVAARGQVRIELHASLELVDLVRVIKSVRGRERALYDAEAELRFALPVAGELRVPVHKQGEVRLDWLSDLGL